MFFHPDASSASLKLWGLKPLSPRGRGDSSPIIKAILALALLLTACDQHTAQAKTWARTTRYQDGALALELRLDRDALDTADRLRLRLDVALERGAWLAFPQPDFPGWTLIEDSRSKPKILADGRRSLVREFVLEPFLPGDYAIPPLVFKARNTRGPRGHIQTEPIPLTVRALIPPGEDPAKLELAPPPGLIAIPLAEEQNPWFLTFFIAAIAAIVGGLVLARRRPQAIPKEKTSALERLAAIEAGPAPAERRAAIEALEPALRAVLGEIEGIAGAAALTSDELLAAKPKLAQDRRALWKRLLVQTQRARHSGETPSGEDLQAWLDAARRLAESEGS